jgi:acetolactate decarboxylase
MSKGSMDSRGAAWTSALVVVALLSSSTACRPAAAPQETQAGGYEVDWIGELRAVHQDGDARPRADLRQLEPGSGTFAIGPLAGLRGEITVLDGNAYIARVEEDREEVTRGFDQEAPFLVFGQVASWQALPLPDDVRDIAALERWLPAAAAAAGLREDEPFPFKIETDSSTVQYHVISNREPGYQVHRPHRELMRFFTIVGQPVALLGVYSENHAGIFTHHGQTSHIHLVSGDELRSGHVDAVDLGPASVVHVPVP